LVMIASSATSGVAFVFVSIKTLPYYFMIRDLSPTGHANFAHPGPPQNILSLGILYCAEGLASIETDKIKSKNQKAPGGRRTPPSGGRPARRFTPSRSGSRAKSDPPLPRRR